MVVLDFTSMTAPPKMVTDSYWSDKTSWLQNTSTKYFTFFSLFNYVLGGEISIGTIFYETILSSSILISIVFCAGV